MKRFAPIVMLSSLLIAIPLLAQQNADPPGPPQFVTRPILLHVAEPGLDHGHFVFSEEAGIPSPLAPNLGTAAFAPAIFAGIAAISNEIDVSAKSDSYEGETSGASVGSLIVGGSNRIYPGNCVAGSGQGANVVGDCSPLSYASTDGGLTWAKGSVPRVLEGTTFGICFDPAQDYDKNGNLYYSYGCAPLSGSFPNGIFVAKSTNGTTWTAQPHVTFNSRRFFDDKYYIAVDRSNSTFANRIYVSWDRNQGNNQILYIANSANGGQTWSAPIKVNDGTSKFERVIGAYPAVDHNTGVVYDSWHDYAQNIIFVDKSTNGGVTWGTDRAAATTHAGFGTDIGCVGGRAQGPAHAMKVGPSGKIYLVYSDPTGGPVQHGFDILLTTSTDGGTTWSAPVTLNDDGGGADQFHATLSVESNGAGGDKVTVSFYDRRDDPSNCLAHVYATTSTDNGATWSANVRLTSAASNFDGNPNGPGDYSSSTPATANGVWPFFCDHRTTNPETASSGAFDVYSGKVQ